MKSIRLTINYKNGNTLEHIVNYVHFESNAIYFTVKHQVHSVYTHPVCVPLENIESFDIEESEKLFN